MGRAYAGVLGYLAAALSLVRGAIGGGGIEATLVTAIVALSIFAVLGLVLGAIAEHTVDQAVRQRLEAQLEATPTSEAS